MRYRTQNGIVFFLSFFDDFFHGYKKMDFSNEQNQITIPTISYVLQFHH